jgi:hypothetical protein
VDHITILKGTKTYADHWWSETLTPLDVKWFGGTSNIAAREMNGAQVRTGVMPFGEILVQLDIHRETRNEKIFYVVKPVIVDFDIGMGWGEKYLAGSEAFCKTIKFMHFNTVNGDAKDFFADRERAEKYPMKRFSRLLEESCSRDDHILEHIHGSEFFGEPQFDRRPAQEIFNFYTAYRNSGFPTTLTLSHEPGFFLYAGAVDCAHFDAYRVVAPHADKWGNYSKYVNKNMKWGAPLETIGDYMRTLSRINYPNPVAAWTQAMADDWSSRFRKTAGNPNDLEIRIQAYEAIANGAASLYWFNMSGKTMIRNRSSLHEIQNINREIMIVGNLLSHGNSFSWVNRFMDLDLNVIAGPDYAVLFAIDLRYRISPSNQFISAGSRMETMEFKLPGYLTDCDAVVKVSYNGVTSVKVKIKDGTAIVTDSLDTTALYVLYSPKTNTGNDLIRRYGEIIRAEKFWQFDPVNIDSDFNLLVSEVKNLEK